MSDELASCHDCGASPGEPHGDDCDTAICVRTGQQRILCGVRPVFRGAELIDMEGYSPHPDEDCGRDIWTGHWPGEMDAIRLGWYARFVPNGNPSWVRCGKDDEGARPDLNRLAIDGQWNRDLLRWEERALPIPAP